MQNHIFAFMLMQRLWVQFTVIQLSVAYAELCVCVCVCVWWREAVDLVRVYCESLLWLNDPAWPDRFTVTVLFPLYDQKLLHTHSHTHTHTPQSYGLCFHLQLQDVLVIYYFSVYLYNVRVIYPWGIHTNTSNKSEGKSHSLFLCWWSKTIIPESHDVMNKECWETADGEKPGSGREI